MPISLSSREKTLLWLLRFASRRDEFLQPPEVSQKGISHGLDMMQTNVSRELSALRKEGHVDKRTAHFTAGKRKRIAYFPTASGMAAAREIEGKVLAVEVALLRKGTRESLTLGQVSRILKRKGLTASPFFLAMAFDAGGEMELEKLMDKVDEQGRPMDGRNGQIKGKKHRLAGLPVKMDFLGRDSVLRELQEMLDSAYFRAAMVLGTAGMGKSTLAREAVDRNKGRFNVFYFTFRDWYRFDGFRKELLGFLGTDEKTDRRDVLGALVEFSGKDDLLLVLDDVHRAKEEAVEFLEKLMANAGELRRLKVIFLSREKEREREYDRVKHGDRFREMVLPPLMLEECKELASVKAFGQRGKVSDSTGEKIRRATGGIPLLVEFLRKDDIITGRVEGKGTKVMEEEVFRDLSEDGARLLKVISLCTLPVEKDIIKRGEVCIEELSSRLLVEPNREGLYQVHDHIRDVVTGGLGFRERKGIRKEVLAYLNGLLERWGEGDYLPSQMTDDMDIYYLEYIHHHIELGKIREALEAIMNSPRSLSRGPPSQVMRDFLDRLEAKLGRENPVVEFMRAQIALGVGEIDDARSHLDRARRASKDGARKKEKGDEAGEAWPDHRLLSELEATIEDADRRPETLRLMIRKEKDATGSDERTKLRMNISAQYLKEEQWDAARKWLSLARGTVRDREESERVPFLLKLGAAYLKMGDTQEAVTIVKEGLRIAGSEEREMLGALYKMLGQIYLRRERFEKSEDRFNRAKLFFQRSQVLFQMADCMLWEVKAILGGRGLLKEAMTTSFWERKPLKKRNRPVLDDCISRIREALLTLRDITRKTGLLSRLLGRDIFDPRLISLWRQFLVMRCALEWIGSYDDFALDTCGDLIRLGEDVKKENIVLEGTMIKARILARRGKSEKALELIKELKRQRHLPRGAARDTLRRTMEMVKGGGGR